MDTKIFHATAGRLHRISKVVLLFFAFTAISISVALAGAADQPVEWKTYQQGKIKWNLSYYGKVQGCKPNTTDTDHKFWIIKNASADSDRFRIYSYNSQVQGRFSGKSPIGRSLNNATTAYLCLGQWDTFWAGGPANVANNLFVWVE